MIDYFALALGHGLMVIALLRLVMRDGVDVDPLLDRIRTQTDDHRKSMSMAARNSARRARSDPAAPDRIEANENAQVIIGGATHSPAPATGR